jgi:hypothetical protein
MDRMVSENTTGLFAVDRRRRGFGPLPARSGLHPSLPMVKAGLSRIFGRMASSRRPILLHRPSFGPSPGREPRLLRPLLTSRSAHQRGASPFQAQSEISPGKNADLRCTTAGFTPPEPWSRELRDHWLARPARRRLISSFCSSARSFAPRFLHAVLAVRRSAVHFARCDQLTGGLSPPSQRPCRAHPGGGP